MHNAHTRHTLEVLTTTKNIIERYLLIESWKTPRKKSTNKKNQWNKAHGRIYQGKKVTDRKIHREKSSNYNIIL